MTAWLFQSVVVKWLNSLSRYSVHMFLAVFHFPPSRRKRNKETNKKTTNMTVPSASVCLRLAIALLFNYITLYVYYMLVLKLKWHWSFFLFFSGALPMTWSLSFVWSSMIFEWTLEQSMCKICHSSSHMTW